LRMAPPRRRKLAPKAWGVFSPGSDEGPLHRENHAAMHPAFAPWDHPDIKRERRLCHSPCDAAAGRGKARQTLLAAIIALPLRRIARHFRRWITCWIRRWLGQGLRRFKRRIARRIMHRLVGRIAFGGSDWIVERFRWTSRGRGHGHLVSLLEIALPTPTEPQSCRR